MARRKRTPPEDADFIVDDGDDADFGEAPKKKRARKSPAAKKGKASPAAGKAASKAASKAAPKKKKCKRVAGAKEGDIEIVRDYVVAQNRPFNHVMLFDNLHKAVGRTAVGRILDTLAEDGVFVRKDFGKAKIYWPDQDQYENPTEEELGELGGKVGELRKEVKELTAQSKALEGDVRRTNAALTNEQVAERLVQLRAESVAMREKIDSLKNGGQMSRADVEAVHKSLKKARAAWRRRKELVMDVVDKMSEGTGKKVKVLCETVGVDTDEDAGVCFKKK